MRPDQVVPFPATLRGPQHDVDIGAVELLEIHVHGGDPRQGVPEIPGHRYRLEEDLRQDDGGTDVEVDPPLEAGDQRAEGPEIP